MGHSKDDAKERTSDPRRGHDPRPGLLGWHGTGGAWVRCEVTSRELDSTSEGECRIGALSHQEGEEAELSQMEAGVGESELSADS